MNAFELDYQVTTYAGLSHFRQNATAAATWLDGAMGGESHAVQEAKGTPRRVAVALSFLTRLLHLGMAQAANDGGVGLQWCMSTPRYLLQATSYPAVTNVRGSTDFSSDSVCGASCRGI